MCQPKPGSSWFPPPDFHHFQPIPFKMLLLLALTVLGRTIPSEPCSIFLFNDINSRSLLWPELAKSSFFLYEKSEFSSLSYWYMKRRKNTHILKETPRKKKERKKKPSQASMQGPWLNLALCTEDVAFTLIYCFSTLKNSITFLQGLNLLLGKGCSISLQLPLQLKSHLGLIWIFSIGTDGVGILSPSFLLLAAIWNKKSRTVREIWNNLESPKGASYSHKLQEQFILTVSPKHSKGNCQASKDISDTRYLTTIFYFNYDKTMQKNVDTYRMAFLWMTKQVVKFPIKTIFHN